jgi:hypothetical protein
MSFVEAWQRMENPQWIPCIKHWSSLYSWWLIIRKYKWWRYRWRQRFSHGIFVMGLSLLRINLQNPIRREVKKCVSCHYGEIIKHLFFQCHFARSIWSIIQIGFTLYTSQSVANIFCTWLKGVDHTFKTLIRVEALVVIWSSWLCRNDKMFNDKHFSLMQVIYHCTTLLRSWSSLHRMENHYLFTEVSTRLKHTEREFIT